VDADTITGGAGNNVIFGELGDNTITGGSGNDNIDGGNGFSTLDGGGGMNFIVDDRSRDTYVFGGGNDIPASSLNTTAGSPLLAVTWQSVIGTELGSGIFTSGRPAVEFISLDGTTTLAELGGHYFIYSGLGNWSGTMLELNGVPVTTGGVWVPIGAVQVGNTYEVAWQLSGTSEFTVWTTNAAGNYVSDIGVVSGTSAALESAELTFDQDLNRDGVIGPKSTLVQSNTVGSVTTTLSVLGNEYMISNGTTSVVLSYNGVAVGTNGVWKPIGAVQVGSQYEVAFQLSGTSEFDIWTINSSGNYVSDGGVVLATSAALEAAELTFNQDLNGDHIIGPPTATPIQSDTVGSVTTTLSMLGNEYTISNGTTSVVLSYNGVAVGTNGVWKPIGAVQVGSQYEVAFQLSGTSEFDIWTINSSGNYISDGGVVLATSVALESTETTFNQDLNGDTVIGLYAAPNTMLQISQGPVTIGAGATAEITGTDSAATTFIASTGTLAIDHAATFSGQVIGFTGTGSVASSDEFDLKDVKFASAMVSFTNGTSTGGTLQVTDGTNIATISLVGNYSTYQSSNFTLSPDTGTGTIVIDPPAAQASAGGAASSNGSQANAAPVGATAASHGGANGVGAVSLTPAAAAAEPGPAGSRFNLDVNALALGHTEAAIPAAASTSAAPNVVSVSSGDLRTNGAAQKPVAITSGGSATAAAAAAAEVDGGVSAVARARNSAAATNAVAREIVSPDDVIRAIKSGEIAIKHTDGAADRNSLAGRVWLFDEAQGSFVPPSAEQLTIVIDRDHGHSPPPVPSAEALGAEALGLIATAAMVTAEPTWLGTLRQFGRKAARVVQQGARWMP
jgi:Tryptophan-rich Synechocystis species C-terminal domain/RTX calcium-binding nonapeptide repeat (4 copies)